jgi:group I intron endonuclease
MKQISGIYKITNLKNGHLYIGMSKNCLKRFSDHFSKALHSKDEEDLRKPLYSAIRKYGKENFSAEIIEECEEDELFKREIYWIGYYNSYKDKAHYNLTPGGDGRRGENTLRGEEHPCATLSEEEVLFCRRSYKENPRQARKIYEENFSEKLGFPGFQKIWHGNSWKHISPEVFEDAKPLKSKFTRQDALFFKREFEESGLSLNQFSKLKKGIVGYGTLWRMVNDTNSFPENLSKVKRER